jgi:hypothetical protein
MSNGGSHHAGEHSGDLYGVVIRPGMPSVWPFVTRLTHVCVPLAVIELTA